MLFHSFSFDDAEQRFGSLVDAENGLISRRSVMEPEITRRSGSGFSLVPRRHNRPVGRATFGVRSFLRREGVDGVVIALNRKIDLLRSYLGRHSTPGDVRRGPRRQQRPKLTRARGTPPQCCGRRDRARRRRRRAVWFNRCAGSIWWNRGSPGKSIIGRGSFLWIPGIGLTPSFRFTADYGRSHARH